jgi:excinuclease ABC subunit B
VDPRTKAGAYGEQIKGPHKPTLDEMGPHAERGLPVSDKPKPRAPGSDPSRSRLDAIRKLEGEGSDPVAPKKKHRHGRPRKTGRPGA